MVPKNGKYMWLERDFSDDKEKEKDDEAEGSGEDKGKGKAKKEEEDIPEVVAVPEVQVRNRHYLARRSLRKYTYYSVRGFLELGPVHLQQQVQSDPEGKVPGLLPYFSWLESKQVVRKVALETSD